MVKGSRGCELQKCKKMIFSSFESARQPIPKESESDSMEFAERHGPESTDSESDSQEKKWASSITSAILWTLAPFSRL